MAGQGLANDLATLRGYDALQRRFKAIGTLDRTFMRDLGAQAVREQKRLLYTEAVTRRTGHSGQLITLENVRETSAETVARGTAMFADTGTRPHIIRPKVKKALRWAASSSKGFRLTGVPRVGSVVQWRFASIVHHPGTKAHPFMVRGAKKAITGAGLTKQIIAKWNSGA